MRKVVNRSKRKLTSNYLLVNWKGLGTLQYRMDRKQAQALFNGSQRVLVEQSYRGESFLSTDFGIVHLPGGKLSIGCENFNRDEVRELKRWVKGGKSESNRNKKRG